jgi:hypothetical protein
VESRPWYTQPKYPVACLTLFAACSLAYFAYALWGIDCTEDSGSVCSTGGNVQLLLGLAGLAPAVAMMVQAIRGRSVRPWFVATVLVYAVWVAWVLLVGETA